VAPPRQRPPERPRPDRAPPNRAPQLPQVPGFSGLRGAALLAVLTASHGLGVLRGGYLGISSVFTLSGFLVATLALAEWSQGGHLLLGRFWERRARRIVPIYLVLLVAVVALQVTLQIGSVPTFRGDLLAALGFGTNWRLAFPAEGFARSFSELSALRHLWPVAISVQFYLLFPLVFVGLMRLTGRRWRTAGLLFAGLAGLSFAAAWVVSGQAGARDIVYYGTHTRTGELLVGVVLAYLVLTPGFRSLLASPAVRRVIRIGGVVALGGLGLLWVLVPRDSESLFHGATVLNALFTAWVVLAVTLPGPATTALGVAPLRWLGQVSFVAYLFHWPIYLLIDEDRLGIGGPALFGVRLAATLGAAAVCYWVVESPLRQLRLRRGQLAGGFLATGACLVAVTFVVPMNAPAGISLDIGEGSDGPGQLDVVAPASGEEAARVLLVGDETAASLVPGFEAWNEENPDQSIRVDTHVASRCPLGGPATVRRLGDTAEASADCEAWRPRLSPMLDSSEVDAIVVVMGLSDLGERQVDQEWSHLGEPTYDRWMAGEIDGLAEVLAGDGAPVLWATSPHVRLDPTDDGSSSWSDFMDNDPGRVDRLNELVDGTVRSRRGFEVVDLAAWLYDVPRGEFNPEVRTDTEFTEDGAEQAVTWLAPQLLPRDG
jgi:peptidoglycan/LPS O-acetylase OafA/YrhL